MKRTFTLIAILTFVGCIIFAYKSYQGHKMNDRKTLSNGVIAPCADKPNCVSTTDTREEFAIGPVKVNEIDLSRFNPDYLQIKERSEDYIYAISTSRIFRFIDDIEILFDRSSGLVHIRSESRSGYSDLGVNKKRALRIKEDLLKL